MELKKVLIDNSNENHKVIEDKLSKILNNLTIFLFNNHINHTHKQFNNHKELLKGSVNMREISIEELNNIKVVESSIIEENIKEVLTTETEGKVKIATIKEIIEEIGLDYNDKQVRYKVRYYLRKLKDKETISLKNRFWFLNN